MGIMMGLLITSLSFSELVVDGFNLRGHESRMSLVEDAVDDTVKAHCSIRAFILGDESCDSLQRDIVPCTEEAVELLADDFDLLDLHSQNYFVENCHRGECGRYVIPEATRILQACYSQCALRKGKAITIEDLNAAGILARLSFFPLGQKDDPETLCLWQHHVVRSWYIIGGSLGGILLCIIIGCFVVIAARKSPKEELNDERLLREQGTTEGGSSPGGESGGGPDGKGGPDAVDEAGNPVSPFRLERGEVDPPSKEHELVIGGANGDGPRLVIDTHALTGGGKPNEDDKKKNDDPHHHESAHRVHHAGDKVADPVNHPKPEKKDKDKPSSPVKKKRKSTTGLVSEIMEAVSPEKKDAARKKGRKSQEGIVNGLMGFGEDDGGKKKKVVIIRS